MSADGTGDGPATASMSLGRIQLRGVRVHNLRAIDLDLPLNALIVVTGVSGSGKSSLAFDTLFREGQRRYIESFSTAGRRFLDRMERPDADVLAGIPAAVAIRQRRGSTGVKTTVATLSEIDDYLRLLWARCGVVVCPGCGREVTSSTSADVTQQLVRWEAGRKFQIGIPFTFPGEGAVEKAEDARCRAQVAEWKRRGFQRVLVGDELFDLRDKSEEFLAKCLAQGGETLVIIDRLTTGSASAERIGEAIELAYTESMGRAVVLVEGSDPAQSGPRDPADKNPTPSRSQDGWKIGDRWWRIHRFSERRECSTCARSFADPEPALLSFHSPAGRCAVCQGAGQIRQGRLALSTGTERMCPACKGKRWNDEALAVHWQGMTLADVNDQSVSSLRDWFRKQIPVARTDVSVQASASKNQNSRAAELVEQATWPDIDSRLELLERVGLGYLQLSRGAETLSAGELQRVRLTAALGCRLVETLYVLDEPTAGLHPRDTQRLIGALHELREMGNTLVVVEHDEQVMAAADWLVVLGPGAGAEGGRVVASGPVAETGPLAMQSLAAPGETAAGKGTFIAANPPTPSGWVELFGVTHRNLKGIDVRFPTGVMTAVTGVSGAGKSSLVMETLYPALAEHFGAARGPSGELQSISVKGPVTAVLLVDGLPPARSRRGNVATYLGIHDAVRKLLAESAEAKARGLGPGAFSFNLAEGGRCPACEGEGTQTVDLVFLPDVSVPCPECGGTRFRKEVLEVTYRGHNVAQILNLTVRDAFPFFRGQVKLQRKLKLLRDVGLDYLTLGQPLSTVSGGEAQRLKLTRELAAGAREQTLFLFEEPTIGLHSKDVETLINCLRQLVSAGHTVIVIEHHPQLISAADYVIDLGPEAGEAGGEVVYAGPVSGLAREPRSITGRFLAPDAAGS